MSQPYTPAGTVGTSLTEMTDAEATGTFGDEWGQTNVRTTGNKIRFLNDAGTLGVGICEKGTFSPTISSGYTSPTYTTQQGKYTKIDNFVFFRLAISVSGGTRNGSQLIISGLPFTVSSQSYGASWAYAVGVVAAGAPLPVVNLDASATTASFYNVAGANFNGTTLDSATPVIVLTGCYQV